MSDRIKLTVHGPNGYLLEDRGAVLTGGLAVSHKYRKAFGRVQPIPFHQQIAEGEGSPQVGVSCVVYLKDEEEELRLASRQYGKSGFNRIARYILTGPVGSGLTLLSAMVGGFIGFWPIVHAVSENGSAFGLAFLIAWSIFYIPLVARSIVGVCHREWAFALVVGILMCMMIFWLGDGYGYVMESIRDIIVQVTNLG